MRKDHFMKFMPLFLILSLASLTSCSEKSSSKKKTSSNSQCIGAGYYSIPGCPGYNSYGTTTGGNTTGTNNQSCFASPNNYWQIPGCAGFCQNYPTHTSCNGGTSTTGGTNGSVTNPYSNVSTNPIYQNWGVQYPGGEPLGTCSASYVPTGITFTPYETRKATVAIQGKTYYNPASSIASLYDNTSSILKSVSTARSFFQTDSLLKVRFRPRPQPQNTASSPYCYIPNYVNQSSIAGYTKLSYNVKLVGLRANGTTEEETLGTFTTNVNGCSQAVDLSSYASQFPGGIYLVIQSVKGNQGVWPNDYHLYGFKNSSVFSDIRSMDCWVMDIEVAADGTKTFD